MRRRSGGRGAHKVAVWQPCVKPEQAVTSPSTVASHVEDAKPPVLGTRRPAAVDTSYALDGEWYDSTGPIGVIKKSILKWAHPVDEENAETEIHAGPCAEDSKWNVSMYFIGQRMSGFLKDGELSWAMGDVWHRSSRASTAVRADRGPGRVGYQADACRNTAVMAHKSNFQAAKTSIEAPHASVLDSLSQKIQMASFVDPMASRGSLGKKGGKSPQDPPVQNSGKGGSDVGHTRMPTQSSCGYHWVRVDRAGGPNSEENRPIAVFRPADRMAPSNFNLKAHTAAGKGLKKDMRSWSPAGTNSGKSGSSDERHFVNGCGKRGNIMAHQWFGKGPGVVDFWRGGKTVPVQPMHMHGSMPMPVRKRRGGKGNRQFRPLHELEEEFSRRQ